ncbi:MAG: hypothetical protein ACRDH2_16535, partial [Anaerolineales bacterium]
MKNYFHFFPRKRFRFFLFGVLVLSLLLTPHVAWAVLGLTSVEPGTVANTNPATLVVRGTDFTNGAVVVLNGYGALDTNLISATVLTAELPAGAAPGAYGLTVINPDSSAATLPNALTITGPTATPVPTNTPAATPFTRPLIV